MAASAASSRTLHRLPDLFNVARVCQVTSQLPLLFSASCRSSCRVFSPLQAHSGLQSVKLEWWKLSSEDCLCELCQGHESLCFSWTC